MAATATPPPGFVVARPSIREGWLCFPAARALLLGVLLAAPLAFGAVEAWAWASLAAIACAALVLWALGNARQGGVRLVWSPLYIPALAFLLLGAIQLAGHWTRDAQSTRESLLKLATDLIFFFLATQLWSSRPVRTPVPARSNLWSRLGLMVTVYAFLLALFAILQYFSSGGLIYWKVKTAGWVFGPYVNHNHYAGLMEMLIPVSIAYGLSRPKHQRGYALLGFAVLLAVVSVLLSGSRGGCITLFIELLLMAAVVWWRSSPDHRRRHMAAGLVGIVSVAAFSFWLGAGTITRRLETLSSLTRSPEVTLGERAQLARDTLRIFADHHWLGTGLGSFSVMYPQYQSFASDAVYQHAHNDYLEALSETGIAGGLLMLMALVIFFRQMFKKVRAGALSGAGWIQWGATLGCCGLLLHSLCDFNFHIPANAAWFAFLLGISQGGRWSSASALNKPL